MEYTLNVHGRLMNLDCPQVMGILNVTPDSFYVGSRVQTAKEIACRAGQIVEEGGTIIDVGACSTRPGSEPVSEQTEMERLRLALDVVRRELPYTVVSVDTFRPDVARMVVEEFGVGIVNDVGAPASCEGPMPDSRKAMFRMVSRLRVPYILMSSAPDLTTMLPELARNVQLLRDFGQKDIVVDPGFGFGKTLEQNYRLMSELERLQVLELPVLVGISRKSMICKLLGLQPAEALNGTTVLNTLALQKGASILRVHDVRAAMECVRICKTLTAFP